MTILGSDDVAEAGRVQGLVDHPTKGDSMRDDGALHSRRSVLRAGMFGGAAALLVAGGTGAQSATALAAATSPAAPRQLQNLFTLSDLDFNTWLAFGSTGYGCAEFGELVTAVNQVNAAGASYQAYYDAFLALARRTEALAAGELASGHTASAQSAYLRASTYYDMCLYFILGTAARAQEAELYVMMERCWHLAGQLFDPPFEPVRIPYGNTWLPGYLLRPDDRLVRRPTVVLITVQTPRTSRFTPTVGRTPSNAGTTRSFSKGRAKARCCSNARSRSGLIGKT